MLDKIDQSILDLLQRDATMAVTDIAAKVNLSTTPCWRRIQRLEEQGYIVRRVAILDPAKLNLGVTVFVFRSRPATTARPGSRSSIVLCRPFLKWWSFIE